MLPFLTATFGSCDDDDDQLDPALIKGRWEYIPEQSQPLSIEYSFSTSNGFDNYGIVSLHYYYNGALLESPFGCYDWHAAGPQNNNGMLDITLTPCGQEADDPDFTYEVYIITELTPSRMVWTGSMPDGIKGKVMEFSRCHDK